MEKGRMLGRVGGKKGETGRKVYDHVPVFLTLMLFISTQCVCVMRMGWYGIGGVFFICTPTDEPFVSDLNVFGRPFFPFWVIRPVLIV